MPSSSSHPLSDLVAVLRADLSERWRRGDPVRVEDYLVRHPELRDHPPEILELIEAEFHLRLHSDTPPSIDEYAQRFPSISDEVRRRLSSTPGPEGFTSPPDLAVTLPEPGRVRPRSLPRIPGFEVLEEIGVGGMGVVYKARQLDLDRVVALKLIRTGIDASPQEVARFRTEARAVARLQHPNVVQIHHTGEHQGQFFFAMEYLPGGTLASRIRQGALPPDEAANLVQRLAHGVGAAHEAGVLHRDLKPGNVLLDAEGSPKVSDFGLAKLLDCDDNQTASEMVLGTIPYMSPEQACGRTGAIGPASDVHALGVILYECLTGKHPFRRQAKAATLDRIRFSSPVPPRTHQRQIPPNLEAICLKCLEKRIEARYSSAGELAEDLQCYLAGQRTKARPLPWWRRWARRPAAVAIGLLLALLGTFGAVMALRSPPQEKTEQETLDSSMVTLREGKTVELIEAGNPPPWFRWAMGEQSSKTTTSRDDHFAVMSWGQAFYEVLPTVPVSSYRFRADIRQDQGDNRCEVGLYVGRRVEQLNSGVVQYAVIVGFDDINDAGEEFDQVMRQLPPNQRPKTPRPMNVVQTRVQLVGEALVGNAKATLEDSPQFRAAGTGRTRFRPLAIDVTPGKLIVRWGEQLKSIYECPIATINAKLRQANRNPRINPTFDPHGGIGVVVTYGQASLKNVAVQPLPPGQPQKGK